jgi:hypothetical protein
MSKTFKENSFDPAPGGTAGSLNYQTPVGTHSSPSNYQDPSKFTDSDYNKYFNKLTTGQPDESGMHDKSGEFDKDVDKLFKSKEKPTPDDIMAGLQYELQRMIKKDKHVAKQTVLGNIKKHGPKYYTKLDMLNLNDIPENPELKETVKILDRMIEEKEGKRQHLKLNDEIQNILKEKQDRKFAKSSLLLKMFQ